MSEKKSRFATVVPTVDRFPLPIMILGSLLLLVNVFGFMTFLFNISMFAPGLPAGSALQSLGYIIAGRQLGVTIVFALALFGKNVRFMQLAWFLAALREIADMAGMAAQVPAIGIVTFVILILLEFAIVVYLGAIASGHVAKYKPQT